MERFVLTPDLITGIADIDGHHRTLLELVNRVVDPSAIKSDSPMFAEALQFLTEHIEYHFAAEEYVMKETGYPSEVHHCQLHDRFRDDVTAYVAQARREGISKDLRLKVSFAVENWFLEPIRITDQGLASSLKLRDGAASLRLPDVMTLKKAGKLPENFNEKLIPG